MPVTTENWTDDHKTDTAALVSSDNQLPARQTPVGARTEIRRRRWDTQERTSTSVTYLDVRLRAGRPRIRRDVMRVMVVTRSGCCATQITP